jgi:hypothetical protein
MLSPAVEAHLCCPNIEYSHDILKEDITKNVWPRTSAGDGNGAVASHWVHQVAIYQVRRVNPKLYARDYHGQRRRHCIARNKVRAPLIQIDGARLKGTGDSFGQGYVRIVELAILSLFKAS